MRKLASEARNLETGLNFRPVRGSEIDVDEYRDETGVDGIGNE